MTGRRAPGLLVTVLAGVLLVSGVVGCAQARPAAPAPHAGATLGEAALDLAVRVGTYKADQRLLSRAEKELTRRCMAAQGWDHPLPAAELGEPDDDMWRPGAH